MASATDISRIKAIGPEPVLSEYSDEMLNELIDNEGGDVRRAAGLLWEERVAQTSGFVNISEGSSSRSMRQEFENANVMAERYLGDDFRSNPKMRGARVHQIVREA